MTNPWLDWFMGRNERDLRSYDFTQSRPVWKTWWFLAGLIAVALVIIWFFWPA